MKYYIVALLSCSIFSLYATNKRNGAFDRQPSYNSLHGSSIRSKPTYHSRIYKHTLKPAQVKQEKFNRRLCYSVTLGATLYTALFFADALIPTTKHSINKEISCD